MRDVEVGVKLLRLFPLVGLLSACPNPTTDTPDAGSSPGATSSAGVSTSRGGSSSGGATSLPSSGPSATSMAATSGTASSSQGGTSQAAATSSTATSGAMSSTATSSVTSGATSAAATSSVSPSSGGTCNPVTAAPDVEPWSMRLPGAGSAGVETATGAHTDVFLKGPADYIRLGARLDWGGSVVFFGLTSSAGSNVIDANDTGRELQLALYDPTRIMQGCAYNASCQSQPSSQCAGGISWLGWDPVQGGDRCNHGSPTTHQVLGDTLRVVVHPLQWNPDWERMDCNQSACGAQGVPVAVTYTMDFRFVSQHVVEVAMEVTSQETINHPITAQEFPTLYVANHRPGLDLPVLLDSAGTVVPLSTAVIPGEWFDEFNSPGPWVSFQNDARDYGVGLAPDQGLLGFQGWRGDGVSYPYFHNVRPRISFGLPAGGTVRGISYLALGGFSTVAASFSSVMGTRPPFGTVDAPAPGTTLMVSAGQSVTVAGWALDNGGVTSVQALVDGQPVATGAVDVQRADVCAVYPDYPGCPVAGYSLTVPTTGWDTCPHLLQVVATDGDGNSRVLGERVLRAM